MRIAFVYLGQQGAGAALDTLEMAVGLASKADVMCIVSSKANNYKAWLIEAEKNPRIKIYGVKTTKNVVIGMLNFLNIWKFKKIRNDINKFNPDIVFSHMGHPWERIIIPYLNCKIAAKGIHDVNLHAGENTLKARLMARFFHFETPYKVVFSDFSRRELEKQGIAPNCILTTQLGCNSLMVNNKQPDYEWHGKFLFFGRLIKYKGIDVLMRSLDDILIKHPDEKLVIAGRGDLSEYEEITNRFRANLEIHNEFIPDNEVERYFRDVDFVVAPYTNATQSGVVLLSYSFARPVIASNSGGLPEQVVDGYSGYIVQANDSVELANTINKMISSPEELIKMKKAAYELSHKLTWQRSALLLYNQFVNILKN